MGPHMHNTPPTMKSTRKQEMSTIEYRRNNGEILKKKRKENGQGKW